MTEWQQALNKVLWSWDGTPWRGGQQCRGRTGGVDCVHFIVGVLDELHRLDLPPIKRLPQDLSLHDRAGAMRVAMEIVRRYPNRAIEDGSIEPGDVLITRWQKEAGPGHVLIASCRPAELWHACNPVGVVRTSIGAAAPSILMHWRPTERETWCS